MEVILTIRGKHDLFGFWAWEITAHPMGSPTWRQVRLGLLMSIGVMGPAARYMKEVDKEERRIINTSRK